MIDGMECGRAAHVQQGSGLAGGWDFSFIGDGMGGGSMLGMAWC